MAQVPGCVPTDLTPGCSNLLVRRYQEGERLAYQLTTKTVDRVRTTTYSATARGVVKRDPAGRFFEAYEWSDIVWNGAPFELPPTSRAFRQLLSLSPDYTPSLPDFSRIDGRLVGPTADLMTFYSDVWLAIRQPNLRRAGDRAVIKHGQANSWADGARILIGDDAIDFVVVLGDTAADGTLTLTVQHVPPEQPLIKVPADWMRFSRVDVSAASASLTKNFATKPRRRLLLGFFRDLRGFVAELSFSTNHGHAVLHSRQSFGSVPLISTKIERPGLFGSVITSACGPRPAFV
jgi:hypothetical protein